MARTIYKMSKSSIFRVSGTIGSTSTASAQFAVPQIDPAIHFGRPTFVSIRGLTALDDPTRAFARVSVAYVDPTFPGPLPFPYVPPPPRSGSVPVDPWLTFDVSTSFNSSMRAEFNLMGMPRGTPPIGQLNLVGYPYYVRIYAPVAFSAAVTITYN